MTQHTHASYAPSSAELCSSTDDANAGAHDTPDSLADLPPANTRRWDTKRKAQVVEAVRRGRISLEKACEIYAMSVDEFLAWQSLLDRYGTKGLMATRVKEFRARRAVG